MFEVELRKDCPMRHENGNCLPAGGFCTAVNDAICSSLHNAFRHGESAENERLSLKLMDMNVKYQQKSLDTLRKIHEKVTTTTEPERPKGRWIYHECVSSHDGAMSGYSCSRCCGFVNEEVFDMDESHKDFCENCGADMRGTDNDV